MSICESPLAGGFQVGKLDLSSLMARTSSIFQLGSISDEIDKGVTEPKIVVAANGDIKTEHVFQDEIIKPFISQFEKTSVISAAEKYEKHYEERSDPKALSDVFSKEFLNAFEKETGVTIEALRGFKEEMENMALKKGKYVFTALQSEILKHCELENLVSKEDAIKVLQFFSLKTRENWEKPPEGYTNRDINPWLFRRRLSLLQKPYTQIDNEEDPKFIISPGLAYVALAYTLDSYFSCTIEDIRCNSPEMKRWIGEESTRKGHEFNKTVEKALKKLGFEAISDVKVSTIIPSRNLDRDYGDVDVLAWKKDEKFLYIIECKDLYHAKTSKEMAEQLLEFKGELRDGKPDRLKKHLDRINVLSKHIDLLIKFCNFSEKIIFVPYVIFSNPVPVLYDRPPNEEIKFSYLDEIETKGLSEN